jgi:acetyl-CoA decarbonylase/synthase complex subunit gamma
MALSGLDIYKLLPKTNCKKCGFQTCLAFAMQLAKKAVALDQCPSVTEDVRAALEAASLPAIRLVSVGSGERSFAVGHETVLFRHEEKFRHPTAIGIVMDAGAAPAALKSAVDRANALSFERVGQTISVDMAAVEETTPGPEIFVASVKIVMATCRLALAVIPKTIESLKAVLEVSASARPLVVWRSSTDIETAAGLCREARVPFSWTGDSLEALAGTAQKLVAAGSSDLVLELTAASSGERLWQLTQARRCAIRKGERRLGFPTLVEIREEDPARAAMGASMAIMKYASIVLLKTATAEHILPLLTLRQNIFTDPQKPLQVEAKVYTVGAAGPDAPLLITTNFSLTYFTVLGEIEASRVPSHLICVDTEGMSVLTAWAAEKFNAERIADVLLKFKCSEVVGHRRLIIPGYVAVLSGELEERTSWQILVGPREASGIPAFLKNLK